jgi:hypothetical protein
MLLGLAMFLDAIVVKVAVSQECYNLVGHCVRLNIRATTCIPHALDTQPGIGWLVDGENERVVERKDAHSMVSTARIDRVSGML